MEQQRDHYVGLRGSNINIPSNNSNLKNELWLWNFVLQIIENGFCSSIQNWASNAAIEREILEQEKQRYNIKINMNGLHS